MPNVIQQYIAESIRTKKFWTPSRIRKLRKRIGVTMKEFGEMCGVTESCVCRWETGGRVPSSPSLILLNGIESGAIEVDQAITSA